MSKRKAIICGVLLMAGLLVWRLTPEPEPVYLGHPISYWVEPWRHHGSETPELEAAAFAEMDERAVRWLARRSEWKPSRFKEGLARLLNQLGDFVPGRDYDGGRRDAALRALIRLGPRAKEAIPVLEVLSRTDNGWEGDYMRTTATAALVRIRGDSLQPYLDELRNASGVEWARLSIIIGLQETNAAVAVPILVAGLMQTNRTIWVPHTVIALGRIRSHSELSVPALMQQLGKANPVPEYQVFSALASFGPDARGVWPDLAARVATTTNHYDRSALLGALKSIDPDRFANTNWP